MKTTYIQPAMIAVKLQHNSSILQGTPTPVRSIQSSGTNISYGDASSNDESGQGARVNEGGVWDEEW